MFVISVLDAYEVSTMLSGVISLNRVLIKRDLWLVNLQDSLEKRKRKRKPPQKLFDADAIRY